MTTIVLKIKFATFPILIVMEFPWITKSSFLDNFPWIFPLPNPFENANAITIVVSASLRNTNKTLRLHELVEKFT